MRISQASTALILWCSCIGSQANMAPQKIVVTGMLGRVMAIGAESTGWAVQLDSEITLEGKPVSSVQVSDSRQPGRLERFDNKHVRIAGIISHRHGVETGEQPFIEVSSIKEARIGSGASDAQTKPSNLWGSDWLLEDLSGRVVIDNVQATISFPETGKVAGKGSCNRFFGSAEITGETIKFGPLGATRMACPEAVMNQEAKYLEALQAAEHFERKDSHLQIYCKGWEKPLRFTLITEPTAH